MSQYRAYPAYKDSGIEWIGQVPEVWKTGKLKHLGTLKGGSGFSIDMQGRTDNELPFYKVGDLSKSQDNISLIRSSNSISRSEAKDLGATVFPVNTIVWAKIGAALLLNRRRISRTACCLDNNMTGFIVNSKKVSIKYAFYLMNAIDFSFFARPGAVPSLSEGEQSSIPIVIPSYEESLTIAATLDHKTARIDALIEKKTRFIALLKEKRQALITHAVTKGLYPNAKMKDSGIEWIGQVPEEWLNRKVFHAFQAIGSGTTPPSKEHEWYQGGTIPWITTSELRENTVVKTKKCVTSDAMQKFSALKIFPAGSLAIAMYGATIGRLGVLGIPATTNQACCVLSGERDLNIEFLYYWLMAFRADIVAFFSEGGGQPNINQEVIASLRVPSPAPDEQASIAATLDHETTRIDVLISKVEQSITLLKERRAAFITAAVTGQIDLRGKQ